MMVQCLEMPAQMYSHFTLVMGLMNQRILIEKATKIGEDLWKQMKRVSTLVFYGDKKMYQNSKAALQLAQISHLQQKSTGHRNYASISGEVLKAIKGLGHSAVAYEAAKERFERKHGGPEGKL